MQDTHTKSEINKRILEVLISQGVDFACSLPCNWIADLIRLVDEYPEVRHIPVTTEEEGIGVCAGAYLAGKNPMMLMQNSGLGRCVNALASLNEVYRIPLLMVMSHRGLEGEKIEAQKPMGRYAPKILDVMNIPYLNLTEDNLDDLGKFANECYERKIPSAAFVKKIM